MKTYLLVCLNHYGVPTVSQVPAFEIDPAMAERLDFNDITVIDVEAGAYYNTDTDSWDPYTAETVDDFCDDNEEEEDES